MNFNIPKEDIRLFILAYRRYKLSMQGHSHRFKPPVRYNNLIETNLKKIFAPDLLGETVLINAAKLYRDYLMQDDCPLSALAQKLRVSKDSIAVAVILFNHEKTAWEIELEQKYPPMPHKIELLKNLKRKAEQGIHPEILRYKVAKISFNSERCKELVTVIDCIDELNSPAPVQNFATLPAHQGEQDEAAVVEPDLTAALDVPATKSIISTPSIVKLTVNGLVFEFMPGTDSERAVLRMVAALTGKGVAA